MPPKETRAQKEEFVDRMADLYINHTRNDLGIAKMIYIQNGSSEWVYVEFRSGAQKRFSVQYDSCEEILKDFAQFLADPGQYAWLVGDFRRPV